MFVCVYGCVYTFIRYIYKFTSYIYTFIYIRTQNRHRAAYTVQRMPYSFSFSWNNLKTNLVQFRLDVCFLSVCFTDVFVLLALRARSISFFLLKVGLIISKKVCFICFNESPLKAMKNGLYHVFKNLFVR